MEIPEGFEKIDATVCRKGDELLVFGTLEPEGTFAFSLKLGSKAQDFGPAPDGFEWTGEERPPKKGEWFWSELRGQPIRAIEDESGVNRFGEPTGGRRILRPLAAPAKPGKPARPAFRIVRDDEAG